MWLPEPAVPSSSDVTLAPFVRLKKLLVGFRDPVDALLQRPPDKGARVVDKERDAETAHCSISSVIRSMLLAKSSSFTLARLMRYDAWLTTCPWAEPSVRVGPRCPSPAA